MELRTYQRAALDAVEAAYGRGVYSQLLAMATGAGKCLGKGTPVLMFDGTIKPVEQVRAGDLLMGPDSRPRRALSTTKGFGPLYRVTPVKGDHYIVNDAHILSLVISGVKAVSGYAAGSVVNLSISEYLAETKTFKHCAKGWRTAINWTDREVLIDPYWLGLWLGDGCSRSTAIFKPDSQVADYVQGYAGRLGLRYAPIEAEGKCPGHSISSQGGPNQNPLKDALRIYDLLLNKHIPLEYLANSREVRIALMAGLIDSDGHITHGGIDFVFSSERLASDVTRLARSLGLAAYLNPCKKTCTNNGKTGDYFRISVSGDVSDYPIRIPRKKAVPRLQKKDVLRTGITVTPEGHGDYYGFELDGDRLFLLGDFTVTHNTVCFATLIRERLARGQRALVLAHRDRLIQQAADKIGQVVPWSEIGIVMAEQDRLHARCVIASVATLARARRLARMPQFDLVIIDECHRSASASYTRIIRHVCHQETLLLGVTATPNRSDGVGLEEVYDEIVYQVGILDLIDQGYLVPLRGKKIYLQADFSKLHVKKNTEGISDYKQNEVVELMTAANWYQKVTEGWLEHARDRRTIAFVPPGKDERGQSTAMAFQLADYMRALGISATALNGTSDRGEQRRVMRDFEAGRIQVITNCDLMVEGVDLPSTNCILFARLTKSHIVYAQAIGRGSRLSPETGKTDCLVLDMVGAANRFDLCTLATLAGVREIRDGETINQAVAREKKEDEEAAAAAEMAPPELAEGDLVGEEIDLFAQRAPAQQVKKPVVRKPFFEWQIYPRSRRAVLTVSGLQYDVWLPQLGGAYQMASRHLMNPRQNPFEGQCLTLEGAKKAVQEEARRVLFTRPWEREPATERQISLLRKYGFPFEADITKGEASRLLQPLFDKWEQKRKVRAAA
jgi:superfamily II DNA or RNA helicase